MGLAKALKSAAFDPSWRLAASGGGFVRIMIRYGMHRFIDFDLHHHAFYWKDRRLRILWTLVDSLD